MQITKRSPFSRQYNTMDIDITMEQIGMIDAGLGLIQDIIPHIPLDEREFIISGITPKEWDDMFTDEDDFMEPQ